MKKKNRIFRIAGLLLVLCFISTVMLSGTFAKYTSEYSGQDTALVARWSLTSDLFDENEGVGEEIILPIWDHDYVENIYEKDGDNYLIAPGVQGQFAVDFTYDADVDADLTFKFEKGGNTGDGDKPAGVPIQYSLEEDFSDIYYDLDELADAIIAEGSEPKINKAKVEEDKFVLGEDGGGGYYIVTHTATADGADPIEVEATVYWRWPYDVKEHDNEKLVGAGFLGTDEKWADVDDTAIGESSAAHNGGTLSRDSYVLRLTIKAEQRIPEEQTGSDE